VEVWEPEERNGHREGVSTKAECENGQWEGLLWKVVLGEEMVVVTFG